MQHPLRVLPPSPSLGAYIDCLNKSQQYLQNPLNKLSGAIFSNFIAKCKVQNEDILSGYMDFLRAKSQLEQYKQELEHSAAIKKEESGT